MSVIIVIFNYNNKIINIMKTINNAISASIIGLAVAGILVVGLGNPVLGLLMMLPLFFVNKNNNK